MRNYKQKNKQKRLHKQLKDEMKNARIRVTTVGYNVWRSLPVKSGCAIILQNIKIDAALNL